MKEKLTFLQHFRNNKPWVHLVVLFCAIFIGYGIFDGYIWVSAWGAFILLALAIGMIVQIRKFNR